ncbi:MAG: ActD-like protein [Myxococcales bacterium]|nr:ActD-like protein [Myxococcales bacterium]
MATLRPESDSLPPRVRVNAAPALQSGSALRWAAALVPVVAVVGLFVALRPPGVPVDGPGPAPAAVAPAAHLDRSERSQPRLVLYRKVGGLTEAVAGNSQARRGDLVQVGYVAAGLRHGVIVSIDGRRAATLHLPTFGQPATLEPLGEHLLPNTYELDDAPAFERFFFVAASQSVDAMVVLESARRLALDPDRARSEPLVLPVGCTQASLLLHKTAP